MVAGRFLGGLLTWAIFPATALACAVCGGGGREESKLAFVLTTALLSAVPLASIAGLVYFLYRKATRDRG